VTGSPLTRHLVKSDADDAFGSDPRGALTNLAIVTQSIEILQILIA